MAKIIIGALFVMALIAIVIVVNFLFGYLLTNLVVAIFGLTMPTVIGIPLDVAVGIFTLVAGGSFSASRRSK